MALVHSMPATFGLARSAHHLSLLEARDDSREDLLKLLAQAKAQAEWADEVLHERQADGLRLRAAFPECCKVPMGLVCEKTTPGTCTIVTSRSQVDLFHPCRLVVDPECAPDFDILDIRVGSRSQFVNCEKIAATLFPPLPSGEETEGAHALLAMHFSVVRGGCDFCIEVLNNSGRVKPFRAAIWGKAVGL